MQNDSKRNDENAKDPRFQVPVDLPHVKPQDYPLVDVGKIRPKR